MEIPALVDETVTMETKSRSRLRATSLSFGVIATLLLPQSISGQALWETNRHIGPLGPYFTDPNTYYGPWTDPEAACKAEVAAPNFAGMTLLADGSYACYCYSNPNNTCGWAFPLCPLGYGRKGLHDDTVQGRTYWLASPGRDPANALEYGCPIRDFAPQKNLGGGQC